MKGSVWRVLKYLFRHELNCARSFFCSNTLFVGLCCHVKITNYWLVISIDPHVLEWDIPRWLWLLFQESWSIYATMITSLIKFSWGVFRRKVGKMFCSTQAETVNLNSLFLRFIISASWNFMFQLGWGLLADTRRPGPRQGSKGNLARRHQGVSFPFWFSPHPSEIWFPTCTPAQSSQMCFMLNLNSLPSGSEYLGYNHCLWRRLYAVTWRQTSIM